MLTANVHQVCTQLLLTRFSDNNDTTKIRPRFAAEAISIDAQISSENWCSQPAVVRRKRFRAVENWWEDICWRYYNRDTIKQKSAARPRPWRSRARCVRTVVTSLLKQFRQLTPPCLSPESFFMFSAAKCYPISVSSLSIKYWEVETLHRHRASEWRHWRRS